MRKIHERQGGALVIALLTLLIVMLMAGAVLRSILAARRQSRHTETALQATWLAEAAIARGHAQRLADPQYAGETWEVELSNGHGETLHASAKITINQPEHGGAQITATAELPGVTIQRTCDPRTLNPEP